MQDATFAATKRMRVKGLSLGDIRAILSRRVGVIAGASANGTPVAAMRERVQGGSTSRHPSSSALKAAKLSAQVAEIGGEKACATKRSCKGRQKEGQVAWQATLAVVPAFTVYRPSASDAVPRRVAQLFALIAGVFYVAKAEAVAGAGKTIQRNVALAKL